MHSKRKIGLHSLEQELIKRYVLQMALGKKIIGPPFEKRHQG